MANLFDEYRQELAQRNSSNVKRFRDNEINYGDFYNNWAKGSGYETTLQEEPNDTIGNGFFGHTVDSAQAGAAGSLSGAARFLEEFSPVGNEWLGEFANDMDKIVKRNTPLQPLEGTDWIAGALGNAIGSGIPSIVAGAAIIGAAGAVGAAVPASIAAGVIRARQAVPALNRIVTATKEMWKSPFGKLALTETAGSGFEGVTEAGNLIGEMRDKGYTDEEIRNAAIASATMNTGWLLVANAIGGAMTAKYGKEAVKGGLKQMVKNAGKGAIIEGSGEAVQEYGQSLIGNVAEGTELDHEAAREAAAQAFVGSGILGGFGGAAAPYINNKPTKASKTQTAEEQAEVENEDTGNEPSVETETTVTPEVEQARNEIIGYRETLDEDDAEFGRLSELLENGNDEEIVAEAQAIRGVKPEAEEATPATQEEPTPEVEEVEPEVVGEVVDATTLETPTPKQEETGGKEDGETNVPPQGETVKPPENTSDNGESQEDEQANAGNQQKSNPQKDEVEIKDEDLQPSIDETMEGLLTEKPKSKLQKAQEEIKKAKNKERQERLDGIKNQTEKEGNDSIVDEYGYKSKLGEYSINPAAERSEKYHGYSRDNGSDYKAIHKNDNDTYMVETVVSDDDGNETSTYDTFQSLEEAEDFVVNGKRSKSTKLKTYWASVRDSENKIKIIKMAYSSKEHFKEDLRGNGYRVRVVATPDKFYQEVEKFNNRVDVYNEARKAKKEANKSLKGNFTVIDVVGKKTSFPLSDFERKSKIKILDSLIAMLRKTGLSVFTDAQSLAKAAQSGHNGTDGKIVVENNKVYIENQSGERFKVNGLADRQKGIIYLNRADLRLDVPVHEYTHIWSQILRASKPELWAQGVELLKQTHKWNEIKNNKGYKLASDNAIADEVLSWLAGENSVKVFEEIEKSPNGKTLVAKLKAWLKEFWSELKSFFERNASDGGKELTLEEFISMPLKDLIQGTKFKDIKDLAQITASDNSVFAKYDPNRKLSGTERKLETFLKNSNSTIKKVFASSKVKAEIINIAEKKPELFVWDNEDNGEHYYYVKFLDKPKAKEPVTKRISASEFQALRAITGITPKPYKVKSEAVKEGMSPKESILADDDIKGFSKQIASTKKKFTGKDEQIEALLGLTDKASGKTIAEQVREAAAKDLPEAGKENEEDAFMDLDFEWVDNDFVDELAYDYYSHLINKYQTKAADQSLMLVPAVKDQTSSKKIQELEKRLKEGESRLSIWRETGWYKAKDGYWKYFIDDDLDAIDLSKVTREDGDIANRTEIALGELYANPKLFDKFPYLANIKVKFVRLLGSLGAVKEGKINIKVNKTIPRERIKRVILHEIQHIIQGAEGMAVGTSPEGIVTSYSETVDVYWDEAKKIGAEAQKYLTAYSEWLSYTINPFEEKHTREKKANAKTDYIQAKKSFEAVASAKDKKLLKELLKKIKTLAEKTKENLKNKSKGDNGFNQAYLSALGEEEARLIEYQANASLSEKDKKIKAELLDMLGEMLDEEAELATNYLYGFSRSIDGDVVHTKTEQQEQDALGEELSMFGWGGFVKLLKSADNKTAVADSLAHLHFILGNDDRSIVFLGDNGKALSVETVDASPQNSLLARGVKAVMTKKPKSIQDDIKTEGWKGWAKHMFRKFYRAWVDKNIDIKDFDDMLEGVLGRALSASESIYEKIQMVSSNAAGLASVLIEGNGKHIKAANSKLKRKGMKYKVSLASVFEDVNNTVMKPYEEYLKQSGCSNWIEALGAYLGWRRLAEMARLHRKAFEQEHAEWKARKRAYDEWANSGRIGKNPLLEQYEVWEAYQKNLKNSKRRWERNGKIGPDPTKAIKEEWLATHKDEEAPKRFVGKEPEFVPYKTPKEAGNLTEEELNELIKQAPAPFAEAAKKYYMLNDNILSIMEDAGLIDAKTHELLNEKYKDYCPMIRDFSDTAAVDAYVESITYGGNGVANVSSMLKKIREEGSERTIINPLESTIQTIAAVTNRAERNKAGQHLVMMMNRAEDLKGYIKKLEQPKHGTIQADPKNCIFTVMFNGKKVAYQADPNYYQAIVGYNLPTSSLLMRIPQTAAKCLRTGATMSPSFIVRNILRDTVTAGIASNNSFVPIIDTIRGAMELRNNPEFRAKFEASGVVAFNDYGSAESAYQNLTDMASGKNYSVYEPKKIISGVLQAALKGNGIEALKTLGISLEQLSSYVESATRAGEFKKALDSGKSLEEAAYDAKEVTLNFSRSGIIGQRVNQNVPFFNACIQGGDKMIRLFYENPTSTALKVGLYIILPSLALWWMNHDKDWYEELDPATKYTHWCLPNGVRIPKPQEYGVLWGGGIEAMLDQAFTKDPRAMKEWADAARDAITPSVVPTVVLPLLEWVTNYSFFKGRDLVPQRLQRMPDELQYNTGTSELSKFIGKHTYASPIKIDNLVRGYTGTMGMFLWQTPDWFAAEKQNLPAKELGEMQFIRDFNVTEANRNRYLNDFYELQQKANQQQAGYGLKGKPSAAIKAIRNVGKTINELNKQIRTIEVSDKYSPERKRELIDAKRARIRKAAKLVVQKYGKDFL